MTYNLTLLENGNTLYGLFQIANTYTNNILGIALTVLVGLLIYYRYRDEPTPEVMVATTFAMAITAVLFRILGLVDNYVVGGVIILFILAFVFLQQKE